MKSKTTRHGLKRMTALLLAVVLCVGMVPTAFAAQQDSYHDPAENWQEANNRTNELDANATVTHETFNCKVCKQQTSFIVFRTPEYTRDGQTAMSRNVKYSDGTFVDGSGKGSILDGVPGQDAYYTAYHWTKAVCETCGSINTNMAKTDYGYLKNVYWLYDCANNFFEELPETQTIEQADSEYHRVITTSGEYCGFCYGTFKEENSTLERHHMENAIRPELAHDRFVEMDTCARCGATRLEGDEAAGHIPGDPATCTDPQLCTRCGAVIENALGHDYAEEVTEPTCTEMGYTTYTCTRCGDAYKGDYTEAAGHKPGDWIIDKEPTTDSEGSKHRECEVCGEKLEEETIEKIYNQATTDSKGEAVVGGYLVIVTDTDTKDPVSNAIVTLHADDTLSIRIPNSRPLDYADQTTVTVLLTKDKSAVEGMFVTMTDKHDNYCAGNTDSNGQVTVPGTSGKTNEDGNTTVGWEDEDGDRWTLTVTVEDYETGRPIEDAEVSIGKGGNITVTLPDGTDMDEDNRITVTVTDNERDPQEGVTVIVKGDLGQSERGETDEDGKLTVPAVTETEYHGAYIYGYTDGTFGPERSMSRSEAAAIFARLLSDRLDERIPSGNNVKFKDIDPDMWYAGYVEYLTGYGVAVGYNDRTYRGDKAITRAEFTAMAARFFDVYGDGAEEIMEQYEGFDDVSDGYWAAEYIKDAAIHGWVEGYGDGTFRADDPIDRAEVVTIVNRLLGREADEDYIADNHRRLVMFPDVSSRHWAYYNVLEAANAHTAILTAPETWDK